MNSKALKYLRRRARLALSVSTLREKRYYGYKVMKTVMLTHPVTGEPLIDPQTNEPAIVKKIRISLDPACPQGQYRTVKRGIHDFSTRLVEAGKRRSAATQGFSIRREFDEFRRAYPANLDWVDRVRGSW